MTSNLDLRERAELCDLFVRLGPSAPTLCEGWTTFDLACHLAIRERDPRSAPGILFGGPFASYTNKLMERESRRGFPAVVARVRTLPRGPLRLAPLRAAMSLVEYTVHHEDVRRANGEGPRRDRPDLQEAIWGMLGRLGPLMARRAHTGRRLELVASGTTSGARGLGKGPVVTLTGDPVELLLYLYGRRGAAIVQMAGAEADRAAVEAANFGL